MAGEDVQSNSARRPFPTPTHVFGANLQSIGAWTTVGRHVFSVYAANATVGFMGIIVIPVSMRYLGAEGYGLVSFYGILMSYVALADLGVSKNLLRLLASDRSREIQCATLRTALGLYLSVCLLLIVLLPLLVFAIPRVLFPVPEIWLCELRWIIVLAIIEYVIGIPASVTQTYCVANERFGCYWRYVLISGLVRYTLLVGAAVAFQSASITAAVLAFRRVIDFLVATELMGALPREAWRPRFDWVSCRQMFANSTALSVAQGLYATLMASGAILTNALFGLHMAGIYRVSFDLACKVLTVSNGVMLVIFPRVAKVLRDHARRPGLQVPIARALNLSWSMYFLWIVAEALLAPTVLPWLGLTNRTTIDLFVLLSLGAGMMAHANFSNEVLQAGARYWDNIRLSVLGVILMASLFYVTAARFGVLGVAAAWIASQTAFAIAADRLSLSLIGAPKTLHSRVLASKCVGFAAVGLGLAAYFGYLHGAFLWLSVAVSFCWAGLACVRCMQILPETPGARSAPSHAYV